MQWKQEIHAQLNAAEIFILLVTSDFIASDYCYSIEMTQALERYRRGVVQIIPVILRYALWQETPLRDLQVVPQDALPVMDGSWTSIDEALDNVSYEIQNVVEDLIKYKSEIQKQQEKMKYAHLTSEVAQLRRENEVLTPIPFVLKKQEKRVRNK